MIDARQSYLQDVVVAGLKALGFEKQAENSIHFSYEMVALSPRCCAELGIELTPEDAKKPYVEVSGRKGLGVKADDLMDKLVETALVEVSSRHPEDNPVAQRAIATEIAMGALRYFLLKFTRTTVIAFDFQEALSFEGETGPYVQYAAVRARNIFRKLEERGEAKPEFAAELTREAMARQLASEECWQILLAASKADSAVDRAVTAGEPAHVAKYAFQLAQTFNNFYHQYPVLAEPDPRAQSLPALDDRFLPRATGAHAGDPRHRASGVHVADWYGYMLLALDVGNTNITIGIFKNGVLADHRRLRTVREQTSDEWGILLSSLLALRGARSESARRHRHFFRRSASEQRAGRDVAKILRHRSDVCDGRDRYGPDDPL